jgi:hypothetical protein
VSLRASTSRRQPHHIYSNASAWEPCSGGAFPPGHWVAGSTKKGGSQLPGTLEAQRFIWAHQHPPDCRAARFLLYRGHASGIGSALHHMGQALALALQLGRVLVVAPDRGYPYYDAGKCGEGTPFEACYFEPLSSCSWRDAAGEAPGGCINAPSQLQDHKTRTVCFTGAFDAPDYHLQTVPPQFARLLESLPITRTKRYYWWRAQSAAYIVRPNARARAEIAARTRRAFAGQRIRPGTISVHVRHGDKHRESPPVADGVYLQRAQEMVPPLKRRIFLSTEDPATVDFFASRSAWRVQTLDTPLKPDSSKATLEYVAERGGWEEMLNSLVALDLALQCDAWVGTLSSNWCRLIDELRATVRCAAHAPYLDAEQANPPQFLDW